jgi:hypothetical protein
MGNPSHIARGSQVPTKYEILASLIDSEAKSMGDESGYHYALIGVLRDLHEWEAAKTSAEDLAEAIYSRLALVATVESFDDELAPGEVDPVTGRYNADNS